MPDTSTSGTLDSDLCFLPSHGSGIENVPSVQPSSALNRMSFGSSPESAYCSSRSDSRTASNLMRSLTLNSGEQITLRTSRLTSGLDFEFEPECIQSTMRKVVAFLKGPSIFSFTAFNERPKADHQGRSSKAFDRDSKLGELSTSAGEGTRG